MQCRIIVIMLLASRECESVSFAFRVAASMPVSSDVQQLHRCGEWDHEVCCFQFVCYIANLTIQEST